MKNARYALFIIALPLTIVAANTPVYAAAKVKKQSICNKSGTLIVRTGKCRKGESLVDLSMLVQNSVSTVLTVSGPQGAQGAKGDTGATGQQGNPAGFDVTACYTKESTNGANAQVGANQPSSRNLKCNNTSGSEFMLNSAWNVSPSGSANNKPFVQSKVLDLDPSGKFPVGVTYAFQQSVSNGNIYATFVKITCCPR